MDAQKQKRQIQIAVASLGVLWPYLSRLPGVMVHGAGWLISFLGDRVIEGFIFFGLFNAIFWGSIVLAIGSYKNPRFAWLAIISGFALAGYGYGTINLAGSSTAALGLIFIPIGTLPFIFAGWIAGHYFDRRKNSSLNV